VIHDEARFGDLLAPRSTLEKAGVRNEIVDDASGLF
jgi:hypothetical protein